MLGCWCQMNNKRLNFCPKDERSDNYIITYLPEKGDSKT